MHYMCLHVENLSNVIKMRIFSGEKSFSNRNNGFSSKRNALKAIISLSCPTILARFDIVSYYIAGLYDHICAISAYKSI